MARNKYDNRRKGGGNQQHRSNSRSKSRSSGSDELNRPVFKLGSGRVDLAEWLDLEPDGSEKHRVQIDCWFPELDDEGEHTGQYGHSPYIPIEQLPNVWFLVTSMLIRHAKHGIRSAERAAEGGRDRSERVVRSAVDTAGGNGRHDDRDAYDRR